MVFKRRDKPPFWHRLREIVVPRKGVWRGAHYVGKRIRRLPDSPHRIALGFACGTFASFTPLFGFHFVVAAAFAWLVRGNMLASAFGTAVGNPITFPVIAASSLHIGWWLTGETPSEDMRFDWDWLIENLDDIFFPYAIGGILPGIAAGVTAYLVLGPVVAAYQERRRRKLHERAARLRARIDEESRAYAVHDAREGDNA
ncbi:MAG: DUF2062 domain-containing protein [Paracoccaceae bacterium]